MYPSDDEGFESEDVSGDSETEMDHDILVGPLYLYEDDFNALQEQGIRPATPIKDGNFEVIYLQDEEEEVQQPQKVLCKSCGCPLASHKVARSQNRVLANEARNYNGVPPDNNLIICPPLKDRKAHEIIVQPVRIKIEAGIDLNIDKPECSTWRQKENNQDGKENVHEDELPKLVITSNDFECSGTDNVSTENNNIEEYYNKYLAGFLSNISLEEPQYKNNTQFSQKSNASSNSSSTANINEVQSRASTSGSSSNQFPQGPGPSHSLSQSHHQQPTQFIISRANSN